MDLNLREITDADAQLLFDWANDPLVRENAIHSEPIQWENHLNWFESKLKSSDTFIYIAIADDVEVGQIRFDLNDGCYEIDYSIASAQRGKGFGNKMVGAGIAKMRSQFPGTPIKALVKKANIASMRVFEKLGFECVEDGEMKTYLLS